MWPPVPAGRLCLAEDGTSVRTAAERPIDAVRHPVSADDPSMSSQETTVSIPTIRPHVWLIALLVLAGLTTSLWNSAGADAQDFICQGKTPTIVVDEPAAVVNGTSGPDVISIVADDAFVHGFAGNDLVCDFVGTSKVFGDGGHDEIYGAGVAIGGAEGDVIRGVERGFGDGGNDVVEAEVVAEGGPGNDVVSAAEAFGEGGNDRLSGAFCDGGPGTDRASDGSCPTRVNIP